MRKGRSTTDRPSDRDLLDQYGITLFLMKKLKPPPRTFRNLTHLATSIQEQFNTYRCGDRLLITHPRSALQESASRLGRTTGGVGAAGAEAARQDLNVRYRSDRN
jgi:hypothetical protein